MSEIRRALNKLDTIRTDWWDSKDPSGHWRADAVRREDAFNAALELLVEMALVLVRMEEEAT